MTPAEHVTLLLRADPSPDQESNSGSQSCLNKEINSHSRFSDISIFIVNPH